MVRISLGRLCWSWTSFARFDGRTPEFRMCLIEEIRDQQRKAGKGCCNVLCTRGSRCRMCLGCLPRFYWIHLHNRGSWIERLLSCCMLVLRPTRPGKAKTTTARSQFLVCRPQDDKAWNFYSRFAVLIIDRGIDAKSGAPDLRASWWVR